MLFNMFSRNTSGIVFLSSQGLLGSISYIYLLDYLGQAQICFQVS